MLIIAFGRLSLHRTNISIESYCFKPWKQAKCVWFTLKKLSYQYDVCGVSLWDPFCGSLLALILYDHMFTDKLRGGDKKLLSRGHPSTMAWGAGTSEFTAR